MAASKIREIRVCPGTAVTVITDIGTRWWDGWYVSQQSLDWTIVLKTKAYDSGAISVIDPTTSTSTTKTLAKADKEAMLDALEAAFPSGARPTNYDCEMALADAAQRALFKAIDAELRVRGLEFQVAWNALDPCGESKPWVDKVLEFRAANLKPLTYEFTTNNDSELQEAIRELASARDRKKYDEEALKRVRAEAAKPSAASAGELPEVNVAKCEMNVADDDAKIEACQKRIKALEDSGEHACWSFGGHKRYGMLGEDVDVLKREFLTFDFIKSGGRFGELIVDTYLRYFNREGAPDAINTTDRTFTYGSGFNCTGGLGLHLLETLRDSTMKPEALTRPARRAIEVGTQYLKCCGVAILKQIGPYVNDFRVLHVEGEGDARVPYVVMTRFCPPVPPPKKGMATDDTEEAEADQWHRDERFLAFRYLRRQTNLLRAFIAIADKAPLVDKSAKPVAFDPLGALTGKYQVSMGLHQAGLYVMFSKTRFNLTHLTPRSSLFTFVHHLRPWWSGSEMYDPMQWAIARGFVRSRHLRKGETTERGALIERKGDAAPLAPETPGAEWPVPPPPPPRKKGQPAPSPRLPGAIDDVEEDDATQIVGYTVDTSDLGQYQMARAVWIYWVVSTMKRAIADGDKRWEIKGTLKTWDDPKGGNLSGTAFNQKLADAHVLDSDELLGSADAWATACMMWWEFCRDFAGEVSGLTLGKSLAASNDINWVTRQIAPAIGADSSLTLCCPLETFESAVARRAQKLLDTERWRWIDVNDPSQVARANDDTPMPVDALDYEYFLRLKNAAREEIEGENVVIYISEKRLKIARSRLFVTSLISPFPSEGRYVLCSRRDFAEVVVPYDMKTPWNAYAAKSAW